MKSVSQYYYLCNHPFQGIHLIFAKPQQKIENAKLSARKIQSFRKVCMTREIYPHSLSKQFISYFFHPRRRYQHTKHHISKDSCT